MSKICPAILFQNWNRLIRDSNQRVRTRGLLPYLLCGVMVMPWPVSAAEETGAVLAPVSSPAAAPSSSGVSRAALLNLAEQFVNKVDVGFERADNYLETVQGRENFKAIPDGEVLLLQVGVGGRQGIKFTQPLMAIKMGEDVLVSLYDFASVAQFPIEVKPAEKKAEGWFIRENRKFLLDANAMVIEADGQVYPLVEGDVLIDDADIMLRSAVLAKVFGFQGNISLRYQRMDVATQEKWPSLEKLERMRKRGREYVPPAELPRQQEPYQWISVPNIDVSTNYNYRRPGSGAKSTQARDHAIVATGDLLGHTLRASIGGDDFHAVQNVRATLSKESDKPDLLGFMKAREYELGDITAVPVPGAQGNRAGAGVRITNRSPYQTSDAVTEINGDVTPGWDVELYRGTQFVDVISSSDGRYRFEDVRLSGGENNFRVIKYGPMGEVEEEEVPIYSSPRKYDGAYDLYEMSVSAADTDVWTRDTQRTSDKYSPIVAGTYERQLSLDTSVKGGLFTSETDGEQKTFVHSGLATYLGNTILNLGATADVDGSYTTSATARRQILGQSVTADAAYTADDYGSLKGVTSPSNYELGLGVRGSLPALGNFSLGNYAATTRYNQDDQDNSTQVNRLTLSNRVGGLTFNNTLTNEISKSPGFESSTTEGRAGVAGTFKGTRWRASMDYDVDPESHINGYQLDLSRRLAKDLNGRFTMSHDPDTDFNEWRSAVVWQGDHVTLSPGVSYNTNRDIAAFVNARFGVSYDKYSHQTVVSGDRVTDFGSISAFVYLDKNGDLTFSEGDEPLQDATVEAVHARRTGVTDETGQAFIHDIGTDLVTDVKLNEFSFYDPFMVPGTKGVSILPRNGHTARIEFPVHNGGELDGTIYVAMKDGKDRSAKNLRVHLFNMDGTWAQTATVSYDGFYLFQKIHPGQYWLLVDAQDAANQSLIRPLPQKLTFGYEGTLIYGHKIVLRKADEDQYDVATSIGDDYAPYLLANPQINPAMIQGQYVLNFGEYRSRALMNVMWYKLKMLNGGLIRDVRLLSALSDLKAAGDPGVHIVRGVVPGMNMQQAWDRCYAIIARGVSCKVEMLPTGLGNVPSVVGMHELDTGPRFADQRARG